ncbi:MAG: DUF427 domain-containing protein [bacterium]
MTQTQITIKDSTDQKIIAQGILGQDVLKVEGNFYFYGQKVDLQGLSKKEKAYHCPIKNSDCDYYFVNDDQGKPMETELCWIYSKIPNSLFKQLENMVGFYSFDRGNGAIIKEKQI